jgi:hypothetical protein
MMENNSAAKEQERQRLQLEKEHASKMAGLRKLDCIPPKLDGGM